jgi:tRNA A64-2'-O-ribosylphosphate transferase
MEDEEGKDAVVPAPTTTITVLVPSWKEKRERQKETNRARNRLFSIDRDVTNFILPLQQQTKLCNKHKQHNKQNSRISSWPWLANERCGCWYALPVTKQSCYFKSVDGHVNTWSMSTKRLNLQLVHMLKKTGGCFILDASRTKVFPDSLARTIPLWAAVMNRMVLRFRQERGMETNPTENEWDTDLHTPYTISTEEHATMSSILDARVQELYDSGVLLQPDQLVANVTKPLRPVWITAQDMAVATATATEVTGSVMSSLFESWASLSKDYHIIVCVSCSTISSLALAQSEQQPQDDDDDDDNDDAKDNTNDSLNNFVYSPGAGDDEECWARGLSPALFWKHRQKILSTQTCDDADAVMDCLVTTATNKTSAAGTTGTTHDEEGQNDGSLSDPLGSMNVHVGSRRAGRPPDCWEAVDAVLNVTEQEYVSLTNQSGIPENKYYLQLPVEEGKRDKHELERWLSVGIVFAVHHAAQGRKVLIHCAQGKDRSVAVAMAMVALFADPQSNELRFRPEIDRFVSWTTQANIIDAENLAYGRSGMTKGFVESILGRSGRDILFHKFKEIFNDQEEQSVVSKQSLRITLHSIQRYRLKASPTRSTMQKLNRFFLSSSYQEEREKDDSYHGLKRSREPPIMSLCGPIGSARDK